MKTNKSSINKSIKILEKSKILVKTSTKNIAAYCKKPFSNKTMAVIKPIIALAIKNPSAKETKLVKFKYSKYTKTRVIIYTKDKEFKAPMGVFLAEYLEVYLFNSKEAINLATPPTNKISVPIHKSKDTQLKRG